MKVLSVDYGKKKVGLAISDETGMVSAKLPVLRVNKERDKIDGLIFVINEMSPEMVLFGIPSDRNGEDTDQTIEIREFISNFQDELNKKIKGNKIIIKTWDESYSSKNAEKGKKKKYKRENSDSEAARLFLQEYLSSSDKDV